MIKENINLNDIKFHQFVAHIQALEKINTLKSQQDLLLSNIQNLTLQDQMLSNKSGELMAFMQKNLPKIRAENNIVASKIYQSYQDLINQKNQINLELLKLKTDIQNIQQQIANMETQVPQIEQNLKNEIANYVQNLINQGAIPGFQTGNIESIEIHYDKGYAKVTIQGQIKAYGFIVINGAIYPTVDYTIGKQVLYVDLLTGQVYPTEPQATFSFPNNFKYVTYLGPGAVLSGYEYLQKEYGKGIEQTLTNPKTINDIVNQLQTQIQQQLIQQIQQDFGNQLFNQNALNIAGRLGANVNVQFIGYSMKDNTMTYYLQAVIQDTYISPYPVVYDIAISYNLSNLTPGQAIQPNITVNYDLQKTLQYWASHNIGNLPLPIQGLGKYVNNNYLYAFISQLFSQNGINGQIQSVNYNPELNVITVNANMQYGDKIYSTFLVFNVIQTDNGFQLQLSPQSKNILQFQQIYNYLYYNIPSQIANSMNINPQFIKLNDITYNPETNQYGVNLNIPIPNLTNTLASQPTTTNITLTFNVTQDQNNKISLQLTQESLAKLQYVSLLYNIPNITASLEMAFNQTLGINPKIEFVNMSYLGNNQWQAYYNVVYQEKTYTLGVLINDQGVNVLGLNQIIQDLGKVEGKELYEQFSKSLYNIPSLIMFWGSAFVYYGLNELEFLPVNYLGVPMGSNFFEYFAKNFLPQSETGVLTSGPPYKVPNPWAEFIEGVKMGGSFAIGLAEGYILPPFQLFSGLLSFGTNYLLNYQISQFAKQHNLTPVQENLLKQQIYSNLQRYLQKYIPDAYKVFSNPNLSPNPIISSLQILKEEFMSNPSFTVGMLIPMVLDLINLVADIGEIASGVIKYRTFDLGSIKMFKYLEDQGWDISKVKVSDISDFAKYLKEFDLDEDIKRLPVDIQNSLFTKFFENWENIKPLTSPYKSARLMNLIYNNLKTSVIFDTMGNDLGALYYLRFTKDLDEMKINEIIGYLAKDNLEYPYYYKLTNYLNGEWESYSSIKFYVPKRLEYIPGGLVDLSLYGKIVQELQSVSDEQGVLKNIYIGTEEADAFNILKLKGKKIAFTKLFRQEDIIGYIDKIKTKTIDLTTLKEKTLVQYNYLDYFDSGKNSYLRLRTIKSGFNIDLGEVKIRYLKPFFRALEDYLNGKIDDFQAFKENFLKPYLIENKYKIAEELFTIRSLNPYLYNTLLDFLNEKYGDLFLSLIPSVERKPPGFKPLIDLNKLKQITEEGTEVKGKNEAQLTKTITKDLSQQIFDETAFYGTYLDLIDKMRLLSAEELKYLGGFDLSNLALRGMLKFRGFYNQPILNQNLLATNLSLFRNKKLSRAFRLPTLRDFTKGFGNNLDLSNKLLFNQKFGISNKIGINEKFGVSTQLRFREGIKIRENELLRQTFEFPKFSFNLPPGGKPPKLPEYNQYYNNRRKYIPRHGWYEEKRYVAMLITKLLTTNQKTYKRSHKKRK